MIFAAFLNEVVEYLISDNVRYRNFSMPKEIWQGREMPVLKS